MGSGMKMVWTKPTFERAGFADPAVHCDLTPRGEAPILEQSEQISLSLMCVVSPGTSSVSLSFRIPMLQVLGLFASSLLSSAPLLGDAGGSFEKILGLHHRDLAVRASPGAPGAPDVVAVPSSILSDHAPIALSKQRETPRWSVTLLDSWYGSSK